VNSFTPNVGFRGCSWIAGRTLQEAQYIRAFLALPASPGGGGELELAVAAAITSSVTEADASPDTGTEGKTTEAAADKTMTEANKVQLAESVDPDDPRRPTLIITDAAAGWCAGRTGGHAECTAECTAGHVECTAGRVE
jgi:hypothetical protein